MVSVLGVGCACASALAQPVPPSNVSAVQGLLIGPIDGLTTGWHRSPVETLIPLDASVQFRQLANPDDVIVWNGAHETSRDSIGSTALCPINMSDRQVITAQVTQGSGQTYENTCVLHMTSISAKEIRVSNMTVTVDDVLLDENSNNIQTMSYYFGGSIARLQRLRSGPYRGAEPQESRAGFYVTSVDRELRLHVDVEPRGFAPLIEWRLGDAPHWLGGQTLGAINEVGFHSLSAGPPGSAERVAIQTYTVSIIPDDRFNGIILEDTPMTFKAITDPPGFENFVTWCSSTKYGEASPVVGSGPAFGVHFANTFGPSPEGGQFQWLGVKADNAVLGQDQKTGACCTDPSSCVESTEAQCAGEFFGEGTICQVCNLASLEICTDAVNLAGHPCTGAQGFGTGAAFDCDEATCQTKAHDRAEASCPAACERLECPDDIPCDSAGVVLCLIPTSMAFNTPACPGGTGYVCTGSCKCDCGCFLEP
jgi:hypothetical protein